ncbi:MAG TPA: hypothetical protein PKE40_12420 [Arachnia sp.]|nr:hypothetical protein [Arachnia sp.]
MISTVDATGGRESSGFGSGADLDHAERVMWLPRAISGTKAGL